MPNDKLIEIREFDYPLTTAEKRILRQEYTADYPDNKGIDIIKEDTKWNVLTVFIIGEMSLNQNIIIMMKWHLILDRTKYK